MREGDFPGRVVALLSQPSTRADVVSAQRQAGFRCSWTWLLMILGWLCGPVVWATGPPPSVLTINTARAELQADGAPAVTGMVDLRERWDSRFPGRGGRATYTMTLPARTGPEPMAMLFSRVGNQVAVQINGHHLQRWGTLGDARFDAAKGTAMVAVPAALLHADRTNSMQVDVTVQPLRLGGLSVVRYGPESEVQRLFSRDYLGRQTAMTIYAAVLAGMGLLAALMWWRQRDPLFGWFSLAALAGVVRNVDRVVPDLPLPWPWLGIVVWIGFTAHVAWTVRFVILVLRPLSDWMRWAINATLAVDVVLICLAHILGEPMLLTVVALSGTPLGVMALAVLGRQVRSRPTATAWVVLVALAVAAGAGIHDAVLIRLEGASGLRTTLTHHGMFAFAVIMAVVIAERYNRSVVAQRSLDEALARREAGRQAEMSRVVESERQRLMRDLHDGVGSQLVGLLHLVDQPEPSPKALREQVQLVMDETRMAVDALQPAHNDLVTLLANLRWRLQPRLHAAGITVVWDVEDLPAMPPLTPPTVQHLQRMLQEVFANVLKHAQANQVTVSARALPGDVPLVQLAITDNGCGLPPAEAGQPRGQGLNNLRARAAAIAADITIGAGPDGGTRVALLWAVGPELAASAGE